MSNNIQDVALTGLSTELIETVAQHLDKADLLSLRTTCRKLRNDSAYQFCQRYLSNVSTSGTTSSVLESIDVLRSPSLPHAQHFARSLTVRVILIAEGWGIDLDHLRKHLMPGQRDIARLLAAMPNLQHIVLEQHMLQKYVPVLESPLIFFKPITAQPCFPPAQPVSTRLAPGRRRTSRCAGEANPRFAQRDLPPTHPDPKH
jgi:hypothetical protein